MTLIFSSPSVGLEHRRAGNMQTLVPCICLSWSSGWSTMVPSEFGTWKTGGNGGTAYVVVAWQAAENGAGLSARKQNRLIDLADRMVAEALADPASTSALLAVVGGTSDPELSAYALLRIDGSSRGEDRPAHQTTIGVRDVHHTQDRHRRH